MLIDVIVPGPWWNTLTYEADIVPAPGARVLVPIANTKRVGFAAGPSAQHNDHNFDIKKISKIIDDAPILNADLWDMALWLGRVWLCGAGLALMAMCPDKILNGEPLPADAKTHTTPRSGAFAETSCFNPRDNQRMDFWLQKIKEKERSLILFPEAASAKKFFSSLPKSLRADALLWPSTGGARLWKAWLAARSSVKIVVAPPGGVSAPLMPDLIIVDDESNPAYVFQRHPKINARSAAGRRASFLGAELALGGRVPSSKTFLRSSPACVVVPDRERIVFVDMRNSLKESERGIEGTLPITFSLLSRTRRAMEAGRSALWILDRRGDAAEVFCAECGHAIRCPRCGGVMRSEESGSRLRCVICGKRDSLPPRCPECHGELWSGRRPGLDALAAIAGRLIKGFPMLVHDGKNAKCTTQGPSIILGTRGALALCDKYDIGLAAWLDIDSELRRPEYTARFRAFSMIWESYWRGLPDGETARERTVLIQSRTDGRIWRDTVALGWGRFWKSELSVRRELDMPPFGIMARIDLPRSENREAFISSLEKNMETSGLFVMDPGEGPLWVSAKSTEPLSRALSSRFEISFSRHGFPSVTICTE